MLGRIEGGQHPGPEGGARPGGSILADSHLLSCLPSPLQPLCYFPNTPSNRGFPAEPFDGLLDKRHPLTYSSGMIEAQGDVRCTGGKGNAKDPQAPEHRGRDVWRQGCDSAGRKEGPPLRANLPSHRRRPRPPALNRPQYQLCSTLCPATSPPSFGSGVTLAVQMQSRF